jgi:hypothetical protein
MLASPAMRRALVGATGALAAVAVLAGGGSSGGRLAWIGIGAVALAALALPRLPEIGRAGVAMVASLALFAVWSGVTIVWSIEPDRSWEATNRAFVYLAFLLLGTLLPRALAAWGLAGLAGAATAWGLLGKVVPALGPDTERSARLLEPIGYWNALALLIAMSLPVWLRLAERRRDWAAVALFLSLVALALTTSRGGILVAVVACAAWLVLARPRLDGAVALAVAGLPAVALSVWALSRPGIADAGVGDRADDGAVLGLLLVVGSALAWAAARSLRPAAGRAAIAGVAVAAAILLVVGFVRVDAGAAWDEFRNPPTIQVPTGPSRLTDPSSNHRWTWWTQAWEIFRDHPVGGAGAGAYDLARRPLREDTLAPLDAHDIALTTLAETGAVGFLLLAAFAAAAAWTAVVALRDGRRATAALVAAALAYAAHSLVDMPWQYVAVSAPFFLVLGSLARREEVPRRVGVLPALAAGVVAVALAASYAAPALADRRVDAAFDSLGEGDVKGARDAAGQAHSLNPLAVEPLFVDAAAAEAEREYGEAERLLAQAVRLQPRNPRTWYELARFEFEVRGDLEDALVYADRSYALDSWPHTTGDLLNDIRAAIARRE